jgi:hypothetical protein
MPLGQAIDRFCTAHLWLDSGIICKRLEFDVLFMLVHGSPDEFSTDLFSVGIGNWTAYGTCLLNLNKTQHYNSCFYRWGIAGEGMQF